MLSSDPALPVLLLQLLPPPQPIRTNKSGEADFGTLTASGKQYVSLSTSLAVLYLSVVGRVLTNHIPGWQCVEALEPC